jgi:AsmA protein
METSKVGSEHAGAGRHRWLKVAGVVLALIILAIVVTPFFVNADTFRPMVESELSTALGRKVAIGHMSFSIFSGGLVAKNVSIADDPKFSSAPFFQVQSLRIGADIGGLIFHHALTIHKFEAESPEVNLISGPNGTWNYSSLGSGGSASTAGSQSGSVPNLLVGEAEIRNGKVSVSQQGSSQPPFVYSDVNFTVKNLSATHAMPFNLTAKLPGEGTVSLTGAAGPLNQQDTSATPVQASLVVKHFSPVAAGVLPASEGISMVADVNAKLNSDGRTMTSQGNVQASQLVLSKDGTPAPQPVNMTYQVSEDLKTKTAQVRDIAVQTGQAAAHIDGTVDLSGQAATLNLHLSAPNLPIDQLETLLPSMGIVLPKGSRLQGGTLSATLGVTGTSTNPVIAGPVEIDNTKLTGFDLSQKIMGLKALRNLGGDTQIQTLRAQVKSTVPETDLSNIYADVPAIGTATGQGTVTAGGALNFQLNAKLSSTGAIGGAVNAAAGALGSLAGGFLHKASSNGVPISITGTSSAPVIRANVMGMLAGQHGQQQPQQKKKGGFLGGLLGH